MESAYQPGGLPVQLYDLGVAEIGESRIEGDLDFYADCARKFGEPVGILGSARGRLVRALAQAGRRVVLADPSPPRLAQIQESLAALPPEVAARVTLVPGAMETFQLPSPVPLILAPSRIFQHMLTAETQRRALRRIHDNLLPNGVSVLDLFDPRLEWCLSRKSAGPVSEREAVDPKTGTRRVIRIVTRDNDPITQTFTEVWRFQELDGAGQIIREQMDKLSLRWTYRQEMRYLLELCGFRVEAEYSDFKRCPPAYGKEQIWVARRAD